MLDNWFYIYLILLERLCLCYTPLGFLATHAVHDRRLCKTAPLSPSHIVGSGNTFCFSIHKQDSLDLRFWTRVGFSRLLLCITGSRHFIQQVG